MSHGCQSPVCDAGCVDAPAATVSRGARIVRWLALALAVGASMVEMFVVALVPGSGRVRRSSRALGRASGRVLTAIGVRRETVGSPRSGASLVVGNHMSFLDVLVLSRAAPMVMVAKREIGDWPLVGRVARRTGTLLIDRGRWSELPAMVEAIGGELRRGLRVQVFPEGTTRCGWAMDPFRRAAFQAAIDAAVVVSPVTLQYADAGGVRSAAAFVGQETLLDCLRRVIASRGLVVTVHWLPPVPAIAGTGRAAVDRRTVARLAESAVARDLGIPVLHRRRPPGRAGAVAVTPAPVTAAVATGQVEAAALHSAQRPR